MTYDIYTYIHTCTFGARTSRSVIICYVLLLLLVLLLLYIIMMIIIMIIISIIISSSGIIIISSSRSSSSSSSIVIMYCYCFALHAGHQGVQGPPEARGGRALRDPGIIYAIVYCVIYYHII